MPFGLPDDDVGSSAGGADADVLNGDSLSYRDWLRLRNAQLAGADGLQPSSGDDHLIARPDDPSSAVENLPTAYDADTGRFTVLGAFADTPLDNPAAIAGDGAPPATGGDIDGVAASVPAAGPSDDQSTADWIAARNQQAAGGDDGDGASDDAPTAEGAAAADGSAEDAAARTGATPPAARPTLSPGEIGSGAQADFDGSIAAGRVVDAVGHAISDAAGSLYRHVVGQGAETPTSDNPVAKWAESHVGGPGYGQLDIAPDARAGFNNVLARIHERGWGDPKCNQFVWDALKAGGAPAGRMSDGHIPVAREWGDPNTRIPGYESVKGPPQPGDVVSNGHHVGIFAPLKNGSPGTVSAASPWPLSPNAGLSGGVVHNAWGFRGDEGDIVIRRAKARTP